MKHLLLLLTATLLSTATLWGYESPSEAQMDKLMANPKLIIDVLGDAKGEEAATLMSQIIARIDQSNLKKSQKDYNAAYFIAGIVFTLPASERQSFANSLVPLVSADFLPVIFSGFAIGGAGDSDFIAYIKELAGDNELYLQAIQTPNITLTSPVYNLLISILVSSQALPPPVIDALPPPIPVGQGTSVASPPAPQPVVPRGYAGQG